MKIKASLPQVQLKKVCETINLSLNSSNTLIFTAKCIRIHEFNGIIKNNKATMFNFPGTLSHQMLHNLDIHLCKDEVFWKKKFRL